MRDIHQILLQYWGYQEFRSLQQDIINSIISGKDTLALMPTGGGKSLTYQVSALAMEGMCIVITPLIALMKDQVEDLKQRDISAEAIYTGLDKLEISSIFNRCQAGKVKFLYISPERLTSLHFREQLKRMDICLFAVDEAHCISQWGYDFRPSYLRIAEIRDSFPNAPVLALTATATPDVVTDIQTQLKFTASNVLSKSFRRKNIAYVVRDAEDKLAETVRILKGVNACSIIYVRKRKTAEELSNFLIAQGFNANFYHAGLSSYQRQKRQSDWKENKTAIIVATNAFGMGIDKPDVRVVIHFEIPDSPEAYFQEAGRAGRDGQKAYAVLLKNSGSVAALKTRITKAFPDKAFIKQVYAALGDFFQIAEEAGEGYAFEFDMDTFLSVYRFDPSQTLAAIEILQIGKYIEYTTAINSRSRVMFVTSRDKLPDYTPKSRTESNLMLFLMRRFPGIFTQYAYINEKDLADALDSDDESIYNALLSLSRSKIVSYIPGNDRPYIIYNMPRLPLRYIDIPSEAYEKRKNCFSKKVNAMVEYIEEKVICRQLLLMEYFGQKEKEPCGICDVCLEKKKRTRKVDRREVQSKILHLLEEQKEVELKHLQDYLNMDKETVFEELKWLLDDEKVKIRDMMYLSLAN